MADLSWRDAILRVLQDRSEPMHYTAIAEAIAEQELRSEFGATPAASVAATISVSLQNEGAGCPFVRIARGTYALRSTISGQQVPDVVGVAEEPGSVPKSVEKERGASSDVIAPRIGFHRSPYSHDLEVA